MNGYGQVPYRVPEAPAEVPVVRPRLWTLGLGLVVAAVVAVVGSVLTLAVFAVAFVVHTARSGAQVPPLAQLLEMVGTFSQTGPGVLAGGLVTALTFGGVALLAGVLSPAGARARLRLGASPRWFATGLTAMLQLVGFGMLASQTAVWLGVSEQGTLPVLRRAFSHLSPPLLVQAVLIVGVGAGVAEELFFRGFLLTRLEQRARPWLANLLVATLFGLAHFDAVHSSFALLVGVAQGWTSRRSGSIRPAMVAHTINNVIGVIGMTVADSSPETFAPLEVVGGAALFALGTARVWWLTRPADQRASGGAP